MYNIFIDTASQVIVSMTTVIMHKADLELGEVILVWFPYNSLPHVIFMTIYS